MYKQLSVLKLYILKDGQIDASGQKCIFKKDVSIDGNLIVKGTINGVVPVPPENQVPLNLIGFWPRNLSSATENQGSNFGNYSNTLGTRTLLQFPQVLNEALYSGLQIQYNNGRLPRTLVYFANNSSNDYIATANVDTGLITYLGPIVRDPSTHGIVFDPIVDRYLSLRGSDGAIIAYSPSTGISTVLTASLPTAANIAGDIFDAIVLGDTILFTCSGNTFTVGTTAQPIFLTYDRIDGAFQSPGNVAWLGNFIFTGTEFKTVNHPNLGILSMAFEPLAFKIYFLMGYQGVRLLGYYQSDSLVNLLAELRSGNFDITLMQNNPNDFLQAIAWIGTKG